MTFDYDQFMADREVERGGIADPFIAQSVAADRYFDFDDPEEERIERRQEQAREDPDAFAD